MTAGRDLLRVLDSVAPPELGGYNVARVPNAPAFRVGRGADGAVVLLTPPEVVGHVGAPVTLRWIIAHSRATVVVQGDSMGPVTETVGVVALREVSASMLPAFCGVAATVVDLIGEEPTPGTVRSALRHVVGLFDPSAFRGGSVLGLWGELLTISVSSDVEGMVEAWHVATDDRFDFAAPTSRIEVKTTDGGARTHEFSLAQLCPVEGARTRVVSVVTTATEAGTSVASLVEEVQERLHGRVDLAAKVWQMVADTLGEDWMGATTSLRWDREEAVRSMRLFDADDIPRVREELSPAIEAVRLRVDCEAVPAKAEEIRPVGR